MSLSALGSFEARDEREIWLQRTNDLVEPEPGRIDGKTQPPVAPAAPDDPAELR